MGAFESEHVADAARGSLHRGGRAEAAGSGRHPTRSPGEVAAGRERILFWGSQPGHRGQQYFILDPAGGAPRPVSEEGAFGASAPISPDGRTLAAVVDRRGKLYPVDGGAARPISGFV